MKHIKPIEDLNEAQVDRIRIPAGNFENAILSNDKFWMVFVFQSPNNNRRYKSMSSNPETMQNLVNLIRGGTEANEIAGIFKKKEDAKALYDLLKYEEEA